MFIRLDTKVTYETGGVVITHGLGVTEGFKHRVGLDDLIFKSSLLGFLLGLLARSTDGSEVRNYLLRVFSLAGTRLTTAIKSHIEVVCG